MKTKSIPRHVKNQKGNSIRIFVPLKLKESLYEILENHPPEFPKWKRENFLFILNEIIMAPAFNNSKGLTKDGYTILHSRILQSYIHEYRRYLDYLLQYKFIKGDGKYFTGQKSKGYKIADEYNNEVVKATFIQSTPLSKSIKRNKYNKQQNSRQYRYLRKWMNGLEINSREALEFLEALRDYRIENPSARTWDAKNNRYKDPITQYNIAYITMKHIENKEIYFNIDQTVGRLHTNLTNMQSDVRHFLTWRGERLVTIDISNSQPYISCKLFSNTFYETNKENRLNLLKAIKDIKKIQTNQTKESTIKTFSRYKNPNDIYNISLMLVKTLQSTHNHDDIKTYVNLVKQGQLYEFLQEAFSKELGIKRHDRTEVKKSVFQVLFTDNRFIWQNEAAPKRVFRELFPNVYRIFAEYKKKGANFLPCILQRMEATLILDVICKRITEERPEVPLFTIHDSITTTIPNVEYVKEIMIEELTRHVGIRPNLKIEYWDPSVLVKKYPNLFLFLPVSQSA